MAAKDIEAGRAHVLIRLRDQVTGGLKKVERNFSAFGRSFATAGAALTAAGAGALAFPVAMAANMEQLQVSLEVMLGSADSAKSMMADLSDFAKKTPFGMQDLASNTQLLLNYGVTADQIMPSLQAIGDVSAGSADKFSRLALAFGQTQAKGRLMGGEVMQMVEAGFNPLQEISRTTGRSVAQLTKEMEAGQISAKMLADAFASASAPGGKFHKMMDKMSGSAVGLYSTLVDAISIGIEPIGAAALAVLKPIMKFTTTIVEAFGAFIGRNKELAMAIAAGLIAITGIGAAMTAFGLTVMAVGSAIGGLIPIIALVPTAMAVMTPVITAIGGALAAIMTPIGGVVAAIVVLGAVMAGTFAYVAVESGLLQEAVSWLVSVFGGLARTVGTTFMGVVNALSAGQYMNAARILWAGLKLVFYQGAAAILESFSYLWTNAFSLAKRFFASLGKVAWAIGVKLPSLILSGLTGGSLTGALAQVFADIAQNDFSIGKVLDNRVAATQRELDQLLKQSAPQQQINNQQRVNNQQPKRIQQQQPQQLDGQAREMQRLQMEAARASNELHRAQANLTQQRGGHRSPQNDRQAQYVQQLAINAYRANNELQNAQANAAQSRAGVLTPDLQQLKSQMQLGVGQAQRIAATATAPSADLSALLQPMQRTAQATQGLWKIALDKRNGAIFS
ncbi:MAG: tape measure protein [Planctomycetales bacterium]|nr:tape measure protein [Planctomycetales bacterium]